MDIRLKELYCCDDHGFYGVECPVCAEEAWKEDHQELEQT